MIEASDPWAKWAAAHDAVERKRTTPQQKFDAVQTAIRKGIGNLIAKGGYGPTHVFLGPGEWFAIMADPYNMLPRATIAPDDGRRPTFMGLEMMRMVEPGVMVVCGSTPVQPTL